MEKAILVDREVIVVDDVIEWANCYQKPESRIVEQTHFGDILVSTVFLGLNHMWATGKEPLWFETMIFNHKKFEYYQERYTTWDQAEAGHQKAVALVKGEKWIRIQMWLKGLLVQLGKTLKAVVFYPLSLLGRKPQTKNQK